MNKPMKDTVADWDSKIASIVGAGGASVEEASRVLNECGGNVDHAMTLLYGATKEVTHHESAARTNTSKPSHCHGMEEEADESIPKPGTTASPMISPKNPLTVSPTTSPPTRPVFVE